MKGLATFLLTLLLATQAGAEDTPFSTGNLAAPRILLPDGEVRAEFFVLSDEAGWGKPETALAERLRAEGAIVVGIDLPAYLKTLDGEARRCAYTVSAIESLSKQIQRRLAVPVYHAPVVAGVGAGGAMALAIAAQTPAATIGGTVAVDPSDRIALAKPLCTPASKEQLADGMRYGLTPGALPNGIEVRFGSAAPAEGRAHVQNLRQSHSDIDAAETTLTGLAALQEALRQHLSAPAGSIDDLPLAVTGTAARHDTMAIIISGDGGWRDIDKQLAGFLEQQGVPSVGIDALRYFWSEQTPNGTARDLERLADHYSRRFGTRHVMLVGYSFGANVLPSAFRRMSARHRQQVRMISLLAPSRQADYQISVTGWLGVKGAGKAGNPVDDASRIDAKLLHCVYGLKEDESGCPPLEPLGAEVLGIDGGHHFDGDYRALTDKIVAALKKRLP